MKAPIHRLSKTFILVLMLHSLAAITAECAVILYSNDFQSTTNLNAWADRLGSPPSASTLQTENGNKYIEVGVGYNIGPMTPLSSSLLIDGTVSKMTFQIDVRYHQESSLVSAGVVSADPIIGTSGDPFHVDGNGDARRAGILVSGYRYNNTANSLSWAVVGAPPTKKNTDGSQPGFITGTNEWNTWTLVYEIAQQTQSFYLNGSTTPIFVQNGVDLTGETFANVILGGIASGTVPIGEGHQYDNIVVSYEAAVPEPTTTMLLGVGAVFLCFCWRGRKRRVDPCRI